MAPFQIVGIVVEFVLVDMVDLRQTPWIGVEGFGNKPMDVAGFPMPVSQSDIDGGVARIVDTRREDFGSVVVVD